MAESRARCALEQEQYAEAGKFLATRLRQRLSVEVRDETRLKVALCRLLSGQAVTIVEEKSELRGRRLLRGIFQSLEDRSSLVPHLDAYGEPDASLKLLLDKLETICISPKESS